MCPEGEPLLAEVCPLKSSIPSAQQGLTHGHAPPGLAISDLGSRVPLPCSLSPPASACDTCICGCWRGRGAVCLQGREVNPQTSPSSTLPCTGSPLPSLLCSCRGHFVCRRPLGRPRPLCDVGKWVSHRRDGAGAPETRTLPAMRPPSLSPNQDFSKL